MKIDIGLARKRLALLWYSWSGLLFVILIGQSINTVFDPSKMASVFLPMISPILTLIAGVLVSEALRRNRESSTADRFLYRLTFSVSAAYLTVLSIPILFNIFNHPPLETIQQLTPWLNFGQASVTALLGAFFVSKERK
jgi:hypothetical protein